MNAQQLLRSPAARRGLDHPEAELVLGLGVGALAEQEVISLLVAVPGGDDQRRAQVAGREEQPSLADQVSEQPVIVEREDRVVRPAEARAARRGAAGSAHSGGAQAA